MTYKEKVSELIEKSKKPLLIVGAGCDRKIFQKLIHSLNIPYFLTWGAKDYTSHDEEDNFWNFGITGKQVNNFILKHADLIICLGARLDTHEVMGNWRTGKLIIVDIDKAELNKQKADLKICKDASYFLKDLVKITKKIPAFEWRDWWDKLYDLQFFERIPKTMPYEFISELSGYAQEGDIIITDAGQTLTWTMQTWRVKKNQRLFSAFNHSPMGFAIPASIGAQFAAPKKQVICIIGDGGLQMNLQELQTIKGYNLPIKIFVLDNKGYGMIKQTQADWPKSLKYKVATEPYMTDLRKIAKAFGFKYFEINDQKDFYKIKIILLLSDVGSILVKVKIPDGTKIEPKLKYGDELIDLTPKLTKKQKNEINKILK